MPEEDDLHRHDFEPVAGDETPKHPVGKGVFIQTVGKATKSGTPEALAAFAGDLGLDWAMLLCLWQHDDRDRFYTNIVKASDALNVQGVETWVWGWPHPDRIDIFVEEMATKAEETGAAGIVLNVEKPFYGKKGGKPKYANAASELMIKLRARVGDLPIGLSSYGARFWHISAFPWSELAGACDFGMPQIYDSKHTQGADYAQRCVDSWRELFDVVIPTWGASKAHTAQQMEDIASRTPWAPAVSWWDMNHLRYSGKRQGVVRDYEVS